MLFSSRKPLYFVFHDRSERYFQDSTLQLTFSEWLWLTLRKRGYMTDLETVPMYFPRRHSHGLPPSAGQRTWMGCWTAWRGRSVRTLLF